MKFKTTKKEITANYSLVIRAGYCAVQNLFNYDSPEAYTAGTYGWNADIYSGEKYGLAGTCVVTGYRPFGDADYTEILREYDKKAETIRYDRNNKYEDIRALLEQNARECLHQCLDAKREKMLKK